MFRNPNKLGIDSLKILNFYLLYFLLVARYGSGQSWNLNTEQGSPNPGRGLDPARGWPQSLQWRPGPRPASSRPAVTGAKKKSVQREGATTPTFVFALTFYPAVLCNMYCTLSSLASSFLVPWFVNVFTLKLFRVLLCDMFGILL